MHVIGGRKTSKMTRRKLSCVSRTSASSWREMRRSQPPSMHMRAHRMSRRSHRSHHGSHKARESRSHKVRESQKLLWERPQGEGKKRGTDITGKHKICHGYSSGKCTEVKAGQCGPNSCAAKPVFIHACCWCGEAGHNGKSCTARQGPTQNGQRKRKVLGPDGKVR